MVIILLLLRAAVSGSYYIAHSLKQTYLNNALLKEITQSQERIGENNYNGYEKVKALIKAGAQVNTKDRHGFTPLHRATFYDSLQIVRLLLEENADVHEKDNAGRTPLHFVWSSKVGELLLEKSANIHAKDAYGRTPLHYVKSNAAATLLLKKGADILAKDNSDEIPLTAFLKGIDSPRSILFPNCFDALGVLITEINQSYKVTKTLIKTTLLENPNAAKPIVFNHTANDEGRRSAYWDACLAEIKSMMNEKIPGNYYSLYSFCKEKNLTKILKTISQHDIDVFAKPDFFEKFPNFSTELQAQLNALIAMKIKRNKLFTLAKKCSISSVKNDVSLNDDCQQSIFSYLSNKALANTLEASLKNASHADNDRFTENYIKSMEATMAKSEISTPNHAGNRFSKPLAKTQKMTLSI